MTSLIEDTIYCNDRTVSGMVNNITYYGAYERLMNNKKPQYKCPQETDKYTLKIANGGTGGYGNNLLEYPVGLLTADEISFAGGKCDENNSSYYLYTNISSWTMSPYYYGGSVAFIFFVATGDYLHIGNVSNQTALIPVISLKSTSTVIKGTGNYNDPYIIG